MYDRDASSVDDGILTVQTALGLPSLRRGLPRVVAGRSGLVRAVRWAHPGEVPNIARLLKGGELLLMTGMGVGRSAAEQRAFMRGLVDRGVSGVVVELGHVYSSLPQTFIETAEAGEIPLIELRREVLFVEATEEIHSSIVSRQLAVLRRGDELHRRFMDLLLDGAGVPEILSALADAIGNPVVLQKLDGSLLYHSTHRADDAEVLSTWELIKDDPSLERRAIICPIPGSSDGIWGRLAALPIDSPLDDFDQVAVERAVGLVALALLRSRQETLLATRERGNFLADLLSGRASVAEAGARASALGFDPGDRALLPLVLFSSDSTADPSWLSVWRGFRQEMVWRSIPTMIGSGGADEHTLVVLGVRDPLRRRAVIEDVVGALRQRIRQHIGAPEHVVIAAGQIVRGWAGLREALGQTVESASLARGAPQRPWFDADPANLDGLLLQLRNDDRLRRFAELRLAPVVSHDHSRSAKLMPTLRALYQEGWRKSDAARALHLNRQSLYPRLERIEQLLGVDLESNEDRLALELALCLHEDDSQAMPSAGPVPDEASAT
jgi:purine catabolism regulator